ncbi:hypothetical protein PsorP6_000909 [Peronosclerospora sorghi]|uniref:Uncharacterized protein n=1 Tax=Peronosclerospora sorghi TaxID=230839 RepID=A0ACC0WTH0_9STRA|nr:hypothetical protein PsorP6_000909 [Peronosclerospora sorghi]
MPSEPDALVGALGQLVVALRRRPTTRRDSVDKREIVRWLRRLETDELASLCCVEDVSFVKTLLQMAARSKSRSVWRVQEFQLVPPTLCASNTKRTATRTRRQTAPREFIKRPEARTVDGEVIDGFRTREYEDLCLQVLQGLRVLNTLQSCDTLALSMDIFEPRQSQRRVVDAFVHFMEVISCGNFLLDSPADTTLACRIWGETKELNIWFYWKRQQKDAAETIPRRGLVSKVYLVREWEKASLEQQHTVLRELSSKMMGHLRDLKPVMPLQAAAAAQFQAMRHSLESLLSMLTVYQSSKQRVEHSALVDVCFTCAVQDAVTCPQAAVLKLLLAEHLQAQCSLLLSERLSREEERLAEPSRLGLAVDTLDGAADGTTVKGKGGNHSQRRRASRKKMLKLRRRQGEMRAAQQLRLTCVLRELRDFFRQKHAAAAACVSDILRDVIDRAIDVDMLTPGGWSVSPQYPTKEPVHSRRKKKRKKAKMKADMALETVCTTELERKGSSKSDHVPSPWQRPGGKKPTKPLSCHVSDEYETGARRGVTLDSESLPFHHDLPLVDGQSTREHDASVSYFSTLDSSRASTSSMSSALALSLPTFSSQALYPATSATPFSLSLAPAPSSQASRRGLDDDSVTQGGMDAPVGSDPSTFEWYMPSVFSFQASAPHHPSSPSALDWHFNQWQFKAPESVISEKEALGSTTERVEFDHVSPPSSSSSPSSLSSCFTTAKTSKNYSLASFSTIAEMDASRQDAAQEKQNVPASLGRETSDVGSLSGNRELPESDFLYREGGFFDRQRTLKRRRRPWPFKDAAEEEAQDVGKEAVGRSTIYESLQSYRSSSAKSATWTECRHCCTCACHHAFSFGTTREDSAEDREARHAGDQALVEKVTTALERLALLEEKVVERTKILDEQHASASAEITTLQQTVATLTAQLHNIENNIQELQHQHAACVSPGRLNEMALGNGRNAADSPRCSFSPTPTSLTQPPASSPPTARPFPSTYATSTSSVMGPFVSVPLSVLPPRSKLHWDLCEFAAQLQVDSDARLPAQLAAQRLCMATVQSLWPRAQVRPYGSHVTRLVLPSSDVDLVICLPKVRRDAPADAAGMLEGRNAIKETWQQNLARKLKQEPWVVRDSVKTLPHAAVPIITLLTAPPYNVRLDISFEGPGHNGLATNDVVLALLHEFPPLAPMMLILKSFAIERGLAVAYSGGLSSYALLLLVVRYLQEHSDKMPNGFANASRAVHHSLCTVQAGVADFGLMLMGFLDFYGNRFDPRTTGISVASRCFLNRESTLMPTSGLPDPHQGSHPYHHHQYAVDDAAVNDRTSQYGYNQYWQAPGPPQMQPFVPNSDPAVAPGFRRYGYRSSLDLPASRALSGNGAATGLLDYQQLQQQTYDPHKFDPVFIEDPLCPSNNVGRNCFRIMQIRRAFSAAHVALQAATRDPAVFATNRMDLVAGVALHPDNILRAILGAKAPVNAKPDAAPSGGHSVEHPYTDYVDNRQPPPYQPHQHFASPFQPHHLPLEPTRHVRMPQPRTYGPDAVSRRHSESESEKLTTRSAATWTASRVRKKHMGSPQLPLQTQSDEQSGKGHSRLLRQVSTDYSRQSRRLATRKQTHDHQMATLLGRKTSERSMSLSLSFADVVRDGGGGTVRKTLPRVSARPPRFSRDDMALGESINERWEIKDDSELK